MKCSVVSYSLSEDPSTISEWKMNLKDEIHSFIKNGSKVILYPELFLMGAAKYFKSSGPQEEIRLVADFISEELLPELQIGIKEKDILIVLGSGPRRVEENTYNSSPIFLNGKWVFQNKLFLTPWETDFSPGNELLCFEFEGLKTAIVICFDSEQPDLSLKLKNQSVDMILVPSATTNENGNNRVNRCASARAIELGAVVITSPLVGQSICELIDHNEGRQGFFLPAQEAMLSKQEVFSAYSSQKKVVCHYEIDKKSLKELKQPTSETKPFLKENHPSLKISYIN